MSALSRSKGRLSKPPPAADRGSDETDAPSTDIWTATCDPHAYAVEPTPPEGLYNVGSKHMDALPTGTHIFRWPTGDPRRPSGIINFTLSPPPSPPLTPKEERAPSPQPRSVSPAKRDSKALTAIANLFQGESAPIALGVIPSPAKELDDPMEWSGLTKRSPLLTTRPGSPARSPRGSPIGGRFSLFSGLLSPAKSFVSGGSENGSKELDDGWLSLDLRAALQPDGSGDPSSSASFDALLSRAEDLLSRMQDAYRDRVIATADAEAEAAAQHEETEEARTRAKHLKNQLDELGTKSEEQDNVIMALVQDLAEEKEARQADARARTIRVIDTDVAKYEKKPHRKSIQSIISDSGFESSNDSVDSNDDETLDGNAPASAVSYCSSPELEIARSASINRGAASLVYTNSNRVLAIKDRKSTRSNSGTPPSDKRMSAGWNGMRKPLSLAPPAVIELCRESNETLLNPTQTSEDQLREENLQLKERNKFLEVELEAVKRMIDDVMLLAPSGTSSRKTSEEQCT